MEELSHLHECWQRDSLHKFNFSYHVLQQLVYISSQLFHRQELEDDIFSWNLKVWRSFPPIKSERGSAEKHKSEKWENSFFVPKGAKVVWGYFFILKHLEKDLVIVNSLCVFIYFSFLVISFHNCSTGKERDKTWILSAMMYCVLTLEDVKALWRTFHISTDLVILNSSCFIICYLVFFWHWKCEACCENIFTSRTTANSN